MKPENTICVEIENFFEAKKTCFDFYVQKYQDKYNAILHEQKLTEDALAFDDKILVLKNFYDEVKCFSKKFNNLFLNCLNEYNGFSDELKAKIRTTEILEMLKSEHQIYFSSENVYLRKEKLKRNIISWSVFSLIAITCISLFLFLFLSGFNLKNTSTFVNIFIGSIASLILISFSVFTIKKWYLCLASIVFVLIVLSVFILNRLSYVEGVTILKYLGY